MGLRLQGFKCPRGLGLWFGRQGLRMQGLGCRD